MDPISRRWIGRALLRLAATAGLAALPFYLLVRGALLASAGFGWPAWLAVGFGVALAALAASGACFWALRRLDLELSFAVLATRAVLPLVVVFCAFSLFHLSGSNAKSPEVCEAYPSLHPVLRLAVGMLRVVDGRIVLTEIERGPKSYAAMRLARPKGSSHYRQADGTVHAIDLRTAGRGMLRNGLVQLYFDVLGFETLRHVGTADHLHVRLPEPARLRAGIRGAAVGA
jgi:hypothetical protein